METTPDRAQIDTKEEKIVCYSAVPHVERALGDLEGRRGRLAGLRLERAADVPFTRAGERSAQTLACSRSTNVRRGRTPRPRSSNLFLCRAFAASDAARSNSSHASLRLPRLLEQIRARARQKMIPAERRLAREIVEQSQSRAGPSARETAIAWLARTTGEGWRSRSLRYNAAIAAPSVSSAWAARAWHAAIAACKR